MHQSLTILPHNAFAPQKVKGSRRMMLGPASAIRAVTRRLPAHEFHMTAIGGTVTSTTIFISACAVLKGAERVLLPDIEAM